MKNKIRNTFFSPLIFVNLKTCYISLFPMNLKILSVRERASERWINKAAHVWEHILKFKKQTNIYILSQSNSYICF